ncbi:MAG: hypothetical protein JWN30_2594 [Bacilli bacterium]|nr:hypothetical protein [Bacilli bacterium]
MAADQTTSFTKEVFDQLISEKIKLIRTEADLTQDRLADMIGISKKTLVQVEKGRQTLGFTAAALAAVLFRAGDIVQSLFGESVLEIIDLIAWSAKSKAWYKTLGGKVWWYEEKKGHAYVLQKHIFTGHYRIIDFDHYLHYYSLDPDEANKRFNELENS